MTLKKTTSGAPILMSAEYTYDVLNRLTNISFDNGSSVSYIYDKNGNVLSETVNGSVTEYQYNNAGLLTRQEGNGTTYEMAYRLDGNKISETVSGNIKEYWYNDIGQLLYETHWDNAKKEWATINYTYDSRGNRLTKSEDGSIDQYTYDRGNRLTNISEDDNSNWISYSYDNNGNMLTQNKGAYEDGVAVTNETSSYTYDAFNRLTGVTSGDMTASYVYNAEDRRISKTVNGVTTNHMWDRDNIIYESDASKNEIERFYYGRRLAESVAGNESKQYDYDSHGSVNSINGMWLYDYDSFGNQTMNLWDISKHYYCGEYYDAETGFIYLRNRYYDPTIGRFITEDPIKDGNNWYVYCGNNPVNFVDPLGLEIHLTGTDEEMQIIYDNLKLLTRDSLDYVINELGNWVVRYSKNDGDNLNVGTNLIRRVIDNKFIALISVTAGGSGADPVIEENASNPEIGTGGNIFFNPDSNFSSVLTEYKKKNGDIGVRYEKTPSEIILGHELIHVLRCMGGNFIPYDQITKEGYGTYNYRDKDGWFGKQGEIVTKQARMDELATTGISYVRPDGTIADAANWVTTENALRKEHGYGKRVAY